MRTQGAVPDRALRHLRVMAAGVAMVALLAACSSGGGGAGAGAAASIGSGVAATPTAPGTAAAATATPAIASEVPAVSPATSPSIAPGASAGTTTLDACSLFSIGQASTLAGTTMADTVSGGGTSGSTCQYKGGSTFVTVSVKRLADGTAASKAFAQLETQLKAAGGSGSLTKVDVGDGGVESHLKVGSTAQSGIVVTSGPVLISILTNTAAADESLRHCAEMILNQL